MGNVDKAGLDKGLVYWEELTGKPESRMKGSKSADIEIRLVQEDGENGKTR